MMEAARQQNRGERPWLRGFFSLRARDRDRNGEARGVRGSSCLDGWAGGAVDELWWLEDWVDEQREACIESGAQWDSRWDCFLLDKGLCAMFDSSGQ